MFDTCEYLENLVQQIAAYDGPITTEYVVDVLRLSAAIDELYARVLDRCNERG